MAGPGQAGQGYAWLGTAWQGKAGFQFQVSSGHGPARLGKARRGTAGRGKAWQGRVLRDHSSRGRLEGAGVQDLRAGDPRVIGAPQDAPGVSQRL